MVKLVYKKFSYKFKSCGKTKTNDIEVNVQMQHGRAVRNLPNMRAMAAPP